MIELSARLGPELGWLSFKREEVVKDLLL